MRTALYPETHWQSYFLPLVAALIVHAALAFIMLGGFEGAKTHTTVKPHKVIRASLVELTSQPKPAPRSVPKQAAPKPVPAAKKPQAKPQAAAIKPKTVAKPQPKPRESRADIDRRAEAARLEALFADEEAALAEAEEMQQLAAYGAAMRAQIASQWSRPPSARNYMEVLLSIKLLPNGDVISVAVKESSGDAALDRSAVRAVEKVGRFDVLRGMPSAMFDKHFRNIDINFRPEDLRL